MLLLLNAWIIDIKKSRTFLGWTHVFAGERFLLVYLYSFHKNDKKSNKIHLFAFDVFIVFVFVYGSGVGMAHVMVEGHNKTAELYPLY